MADKVDIHICRLSQEEANDVAKTLNDIAIQNFSTGFNTEFYNMQMTQFESDKSAMVMLPPEERLYYLIKINNQNYLLAGVNPNPSSISFLSISSVASINRHIVGKAAVCIKKLIEDELVPLAVSLNKNEIDAFAFSKRSAHVFRKLAGLRIKGISKVQFERDIFKAYL